MEIKRSPLLFIAMLAGLFLVGARSFFVNGQSMPARAPLAATPSPTYDPLAVPVLPENPSDFDMGEYLYYFHCMPCHGDLGQGLTDDFRAVWVEDHQNCWARGCHGGRSMDEGFPIPTIVPQIIAAEDALVQFQDFGLLQKYLHDTHPPQYPGKLEDSQYQALTAYLWAENNKPTPTATPKVSPTRAASLTPQPSPTSTASATPQPSPTVARAATLRTTLSTPGLPTASGPPLVPISLTLAVIVVILPGYFLYRRLSNRGLDD